MTAKEAYTHTLAEINKQEAPSLLLEDFNYFFNKAVQQYINKSYNRYEINQQSTDDLRALKRSTNIDVKEGSNIAPKENKSFICELPNDYLHLLNCIVEFGNPEGETKPIKDKCGNVDSKQSYIVSARKLTSDIYPSILINAYLKPSEKRPYYFINTWSETSKKTTSEQSELLKLLNSEKSLPENSKSQLELRCGACKRYIPKKVYIDYIKTPNKIELTYSQIDEIEDTSQTLEFPEDVCYEIINELTKLILENSSDPRIQTNIPINQSVANLQQ